MNDRITNKTDKSFLTTSSLFCKSGLLLTVLQFFSSSLCNSALLQACSAILLLLLSIHHLLLISEFYLTLRILSPSLSYSSTHFLFFFPYRATKKKTRTISMCSFYAQLPLQLHLESSWAKTPWRLNHQPIKNHELVLLT
jgi:hypothetical protein